jgi:RNA ligase
MTNGPEILNGLQSAIDARLVSANRHPTLPLTVYAYTEYCQYIRAWTPVTMAARGLVVHDEGNVIARSWGKFFNVHEHGRGHEFAPPLPDEPFETYDKVDGSLAVIFWYAGAWHVTTRRSFESPQAQWVRQWLGKADTSRLVKGLTYIAEAVYPQNRVVVDYGQREDLVLLGATLPNGTDVPLSDIAGHWQGIGSVIRAHEPVTLAELARLAEAGLDLTGKPVTGIESEGWVIRYQSGVRVKVKQEEYLRLAALVGEIGTEDVWRWTAISRFGPHFPAKYLARSLGCPASDISGLGGDFDEPMRAAIEKAPDEYHDQVRTAVDQLTWGAGDVFAEMQHRFNQIKTIGDRGDFARAANQIEDKQIRAGVFLLLDGKIEDAKLRAWVAVKPAPERLFRTYGN